MMTLLLACSVTPQQHRDLAFTKYSGLCVARGMQENTPTHTDCVLQHYEDAQREQQRAENRMNTLYGKKEEKPVTATTPRPIK
jgi:hypothetical protein